MTEAPQKMPSYAAKVLRLSFPVASPMARRKNRMNRVPKITWRERFRRSVPINSPNVKISYTIRWR
jgi:hypothetical protein